MTRSTSARIVQCLEQAVVVVVEIARDPAAVGQRQDYGDLVSRHRNPRRDGKPAGDGFHAGSRDGGRQGRRCGGGGT